VQLGFVEDDPSAWPASLKQALDESDARAWQDTPWARVSLPAGFNAVTMAVLIALNAFRVQAASWHGCQQEVVGDEDERLVPEPSVSS
jgi:hypothetical protein